MADEADSATRAETASGGSFSSFTGMIPTFAGEPTQRVTDFFDTIEEIATLASWTERQKLGIAKCKLIGIAREYAWRDFRIKDVSDYKTFKAQMLKRFVKGPYTIRLQQFHACTQQRGEDVQTFAVRLQSLAAETKIEVASANEQERAVVEQCQKRELDERLRVQFLNGINDRIKRTVMSHDPKTFEEALLVATREELIEQVVGKPRPYVGKIEEINGVNVAAEAIDPVGQVDKNAESLQTAIKQISDRLDKLEPKIDSKGETQPATTSQLIESSGARETPRYRSSVSPQRYESRWIRSQYMYRPPQYNWYSHPRAVDYQNYREKPIPRFSALRDNERDTSERTNNRRRTPSSTVISGIIQKKKKNFARNNNNNTINTNELIATLRQIYSRLDRLEFKSQHMTNSQLSQLRMRPRNSPQRLHHISGVRQNNFCESTQRNSPGRTRRRKHKRQNQQQVRGETKSKNSLVIPTIRIKHIDEKPKKIKKHRGGISNRTSEERSTPHSQAAAEIRKTYQDTDVRDKRKIKNRRKKRNPGVQSVNCRDSAKTVSPMRDKIVSPKPEKIMLAKTVETKPFKFSVGDRVFVNQVYIPQGLKRKFYPRYSGPYRIVEETSPVNFIVEDITTKKKILVHANRLKLAISRMEFEPARDTDQTQIRSKIPRKIDI